MMFELYSIEFFIETISCFIQFIPSYVCISDLLCYSWVSFGVSFCFQIDDSSSFIYSYFNCIFCSIVLDCRFMIICPIILYLLFIMTRQAPLKSQFRIKWNPWNIKFNRFWQTCVLWYPLPACSLNVFYSNVFYFSRKGHSTLFYNCGYAIDSIESCNWDLFLIRGI